ncbi:MAG: ribonuclease R [Lachnospiraceae bacterium]|nr:ribonuclease R [Lachnospiraceae bacterium]
MDNQKELMNERKKIIMDIVNSDAYVPMKAKELAIILNIPRENRDELLEVLDELLEEGKLSVSKKGKYGKPENNVLVGKFEGNARGFGFVVLEEEGEGEDIFISESDVNDALNGDRVLVTLKNSKVGRRREGQIVKVVEHAITEVVGTFQKSKNFGFVVPDNAKISKDIFVPIEKSKSAVNGHKVVVKITDYGKKNKNPEGVITEIIGHINDPGTDIMSIIKCLGIPVEYPEDVMKQVENVPDEVDGKDIAGRTDLRDVVMVTIDGEDAKDLDDAVSLVKKDNKYILGVHIADVSHYVTEKSYLDKEALRRGTSVYLVDRVIPMLPHKLSNGICSLNANVDRLALSCIMEIDEKGNVVSHKICESVIKVNKRMDYTTVNKIIEHNDEEAIADNKEYVQMFMEMNELALILRNKRHSRGSIDFDFPETKIILDEKGHPIEIKPYERNSATKLIEDFMLIANETVAEDYFWQELPFVYRTHDNPDSEKMLKLSTFINNFGYAIKGEQEIHPKELQKLLEKIAGTDEETLISRLTLRSMKQAKYTTQSTGHFGLATKYYCHFTSPIRRYPDLQIHRIIKENLQKGLTDKRIRHYESVLPEVADYSSKMERRADEAERETDKVKKVEYMEKHLGEVFEGVVSSITNWGMYVELPNTIEGMIRINDLLDDYYYYDEDKYELIGNETKRVFKLGQVVKVEVARTDKNLRQIDFKLYEEDSEEFNEEI